MIRRLRGFALFWGDFIVGDDYRLAVGIVVLLALIAGLSHLNIPLWWLPPVGVLGLLAISVFEATGRTRQPTDSPRSD